MNYSLVKQVNRHFHDEESKYFSRRHAERIEREERLYRNFFAGLPRSASRGPAMILDIGTGKGLVPNALPAAGDNRMICTDISYDMLKLTMANLGEGKSRFLNCVVCDAEKLPFKAGTFDLVTCNAAMHHIPSIADFSGEIERVLISGGTVIVGFESNRRFWTNRLLSLPYRLIKKFLPKSGSCVHNYTEVCAKVNGRLAKDGVIEEPLSLSEMMRLVDAHSPNAGDRIDYSRGFDVDELKRGAFKNYETAVFYHYDEDSRLFGVFNRIFFPKSAPQFSLFMKKKREAKIKVLYLSVHTNFGGAEIGLLTTLRNIDRSRFECLVVSIEKKGALGGEIEKMGIRVIYLNSAARIFNLGLVKKIASILRQERPDVLHTSLFYANFFGRLAAFFHKAPVLVSEERSMYTEKRFYHIIIDNLLSHMTDRIITCSKSVTDFTLRQEKISADKFHLIYNAVDAARFRVSRAKMDMRLILGLGAGDFIIGSVGSLIPKKGHRFLIEAFAALQKDIRPAKLVIAGDGESRGDLVKMAADLGVGSEALFLGFRYDIPEIMKAMDIFVLPSLQEGFPRAIVEAMYMGLPVIASNISGIPEIISDGENGFLAAAGDPQALADKIAILYKDPGLRNRMGLKAKGKIESGYLPQDYINNLQSLYLELLSKNM
ncbi:MAG: glycosyltransferase [Candidatus Omnitrophota bacterium]|nr:glycosyltransferase [Candidatus Omnitrophota bacterium]